MAHWHDFNPWAHRIVYLPDMEELLRAAPVDQRPSYRKTWKQHEKIDIYLLKGPESYSIGVRYGADGPDYHSYPGEFFDRAKLDHLYNKYS